MNPPSTSGLNNSIALRTEDGVAFGSVDWIQGEQLQFQASVRLKTNDLVEMRMELTGWSDTLYGLIQIKRILPGVDGGAPRFMAIMVRMEESELSLLNQWLIERSEGGTSQDPTKKLGAALATMTFHSGAATEEEIAVVMRRYEERRGRLKKETDIRRDPFGLGIVGTGSTHSVDREKLLDAISQTGVPGAGAEQRPTPSPNPSVEPVTSPTEKAGASSYLDAMSKRRKARRKISPTPKASTTTPTSVPKPEPEEEFFPPPPPAALQADPEPEEEFFPPPPPAALQPQSKQADFSGPTPATPTENAPTSDQKIEGGGTQSDIQFEGGTLYLSWPDADAFSADLPELLKGSVTVPRQQEKILGLRFLLPNGTKLALRIQSQEHESGQTTLDFRINLVLAGKLKHACT